MRYLGPKDEALDLATKGDVDAKANSSNAVTTDTVQTISGAKTFSSHPLLTMPQGLLSGSILASASLRLWHDRLRFSTPTYETSANGVNWTDQGTNGRIPFAGRSDSVLGIPVATPYARWTWNGAAQGMDSWASIQRLVLKFGYTNPSANLTVNVWSSADGTTWTSRLTNWAITGATANQFATNLTDHGGDGWYRLQVQVTAGPTSGNIVNINGIEFQTPRWGDQGSSPHRELPYYWDYNRVIGFYNTLKAMIDATIDIGQSGARFRDLYLSGTVNAATLNPTNALPQSKTHGTPDTDAAPTSLHHTLGTSANQAAAGNHTHSYPVTSVAGKTGAVALAKADVGLGNVDNTADANKPVSTPQQTAIDGRAPRPVIQTGAPANPEHGQFWVDTDEPDAGGTIAGLGSNTFTGKQTAKSSGGAVTPLEVQGTSNQSADLQQWKDANGNIVARMTSKGMYIPGSFDLRNIPPVFITSLDLSQTTVMQNAVKAPVTGEWFATQDDNPTPPTLESFYITRMTAQGVMKDFMTCQYGGHGTAFQVEQDPDGTTWITATWAEAVSGGSQNDIVRFKYEPGTTLTRAQTSKFTVRPKFGLGYVIPIFDQFNDKVVFRVQTVDANGVKFDTLQLRKYSEWLANVDNVLGTVGPLQVTIGDGTQEYWTPQGWALNDWQVFFYSGSSDQSVNANVISAFTFQPGQTITAPDYRVSTANIAQDPITGLIDDNFHEPEGISFYRDSIRGDLTMFIGVVVGPAGQRRNKIFALNALNADRWIGEALRALDTPRWEVIGSSFGANYQSVSGRYPAAVRLWPNGMVEWTGCVQAKTGQIPTGVTDLIAVPDRFAPASTQHFACGGSGPALPITRIGVTKLPNSVLQNGNGSAAMDWVDLNGVRYDKNADM